MKFSLKGIKRLLLAVHKMSGFWRTILEIKEVLLEAKIADEKQNAKLLLVFAVTTPCLFLNFDPIFQTFSGCNLSQASFFDLVFGNKSSSFFI